MTTHQINLIYFWKGRVDELKAEQLKSLTHWCDLQKLDFPAEGGEGACSNATYNTFNLLSNHVQILATHRPSDL